MHHHPSGMNFCTPALWSIEFSKYWRTTFLVASLVTSWEFIILMVLSSSLMPSYCHGWACATCFMLSSQKLREQSFFLYHCDTTYFYYHHCCRHHCHGSLCNLIHVEFSKFKRTTIVFVSLWWWSSLSILSSSLLPSLHYHGSASATWFMFYNCDGDRRYLYYHHCHGGLEVQPDLCFFNVMVIFSIYIIIIIVYCHGSACGATWFMSE